jgi:hypothetical protein
MGLKDPTICRALMASLTDAPAHAHLFGNDALRRQLAADGIPSASNGIEQLLGDDALLLLNLT